MKRRERCEAVRQATKTRCIGCSQRIALSSEHVNSSLFSITIVGKEYLTAVDFQAKSKKYLKKRVN